MNCNMFSYQYKGNVQLPKRPLVVILTKTYVDSSPFWVTAAYYHSLLVTVSSEWVITSTAVFSKLWPKRQNKHIFHGNFSFFSISPCLPFQTAVAVAGWGHCGTWARSKCHMSAGGPWSLGGRNSTSHFHVLLFFPWGEIENVAKWERI